jgi:large subunit ribosomal protein L15
VEFQVVNVGRLAAYGAGDTVDRASLQAKRLIDRKDIPVKLLGTGDVAGALQVKIDAVSASARQKIEAAGGTITLPEPRKYRPRGVKKTPRT